MKKKDILIIGGGMIGLTAANLLAKEGFDVAIIEPFAAAKQQQKNFDGRVSAITKASKDVLAAAGVWNDILPYAEPILDIRVMEGKSKNFLHYDHKEIMQTEPMGYIAENRYIREALFAGIAREGVEFICPASFVSAKFGANSAVATLDNGEEISAKLIIGADGKKSKFLQHLNIERVEWNYKQTGIVCTIKHEKPHNSCAVERFLNVGPFAILPMQGGHHSSLVWVEKSDLAAVYMNMPLDLFTEQVKIRTGDYLGKIEVLEPRFIYPLTLSHAKQYYKERAVLIGDAAHSIHPVAGQGLNLGIKDAAVIAELIAEQKMLGLDIASLHMLKRYEAIRCSDNVLMMAATDGLNRLFSNNNMAIKIIRNIGLALVQKTTPLKKLFMLHAVGETGYKTKYNN